jgi:signal transduction histidine kinase
VRGTLRLLLYGSLILLPVIVAAVITFVAIRFFHQDKELYVYDLSAQSVDLAARNLASQLESLKLKAELNPRAKPFLKVSRPGIDVLPKGSEATRIDNISDDKPRLRVFARGATGSVIAMEIAPEALLDLRGYSGPTELMVVNNHGHVLLHSDMEQVAKRRNVSKLLSQLKVFGAKGARVGTRQVEWGGETNLVAYARIGSQLAVLQSITKAKVAAAANPLVTSALIAAGVVVLVAILVALLMGRMIIRPVKLMARQAEAIGRGEFGVEVASQAGGEVAQLMESFNAMSSALARREEELYAMQRQLMQSERLNTASRMITAIVKELSDPLEKCFTLASQTGHRLPEASALRGLQKQIMDESNRASNILQNLSRLTSSDESQVQSVEPDIVIQDILVSSKPLFTNRRLNVSADLDPVGTVKISQENLRSAMLDIFLFVVSKATPETTLSINLRKATDLLVAIDVIYAGPPLSAEQQERMLQPLSPEALGSSLELAVAAMTFEEQGGRLLVESTGQGNHISAQLPLV